jgi:hypothetical protein
MESNHPRAAAPVTLDGASVAEMSAVERLKHASEGLFYVQSRHDSHHTMRSEIDALSARGFYARFGHFFVDSDKGLHTVVVAIKGYLHLTRLCHFNRNVCYRPRPECEAEAPLCPRDRVYLVAEAREVNDDLAHPIISM